MGITRILVVSGAFHPEISPRAFRTTELVKELSRQGHEVVVYIAFKGNSYTEFASEYNVVIRDLGLLKFPEIRLLTGRLTNIASRLLRRLLQLLFEYPAIELMFKVNKALKNESGFDLLVSVAVPYPIHWGVALARNKKRRIAKTWVADCGDPYMGDTTDSFRKLFYFKFVEKWFSRKTDFITIPRIEMKANYYKEFHHKIREIPQGFDFNEIQFEIKPPDNKVPTFAFAGSFIRIARDPNKLMTFLTGLNKDFKFVVYSNNSEMLDPYRNKLGNKLEIKPYIPRKELIIELSKMNFLLNISFDPVYQSPSKLIDYALAGRPILSIANDLDTGLVEEFLDGNYTRKFIFGDIQKYDIRNVAIKFIELA